MTPLEQVLVDGLAFTVKELAPGRYHVTLRRETHLFRTTAAGVQHCGCRYESGAHACRHIRAVRAWVSRMSGAA